MANVDMLCAGFLATADLGELFVSVGTWTVNATGGVRGEPAFEVTANSGALRRAPFNAVSGATGIWGLRFKVSALTANVQLLRINESGTVQLSVTLQADGSLVCKRGDFTFGTTLGTSAAGLVLSGQHYYLELKSLIANSGGTATVYLNGAAVITVTGVDTQDTGSATWNSVDYGGAPTGHTLTISDLYMNDGSGAANNDVWGDTRVDEHKPDADGGVEDWTRSAGLDSFALLDEAAPNDDTDYIESTTAGNRTVCSVENFKATGGAIKATALVWSMKKTDAGASTVAGCIRRGGVNYDGAAKAPSNGVYGFFGECRDTDPSTSAAWTEANFNAGEYGVHKAS